MASLVWLSVFFLLIVELFVTLLLVLPFPRAVRRFIANKVFNLDLARRFRVAANFIFFGLLLAVSDAINTLMQLESKEEHRADAAAAGTVPETQTGYITNSLDKQRKFRAERNMYLAGFALTLGFVIYRLMDLMQQLVSAEEEREALQKRVKDMGDFSANTANIPSEDISAGSKPNSTVRKRVTTPTEDSTASTATKKDE